MNKGKWTITRDKLLSSQDVKSLYKALKDAHDLALQRKRHYIHIRDFYIIRTLLETGLRVSELVALKNSDILGNLLIVKQGKGGKKRTVLLTQETKKMLRQFLRAKKTLLNEPTDPDSYLFVSERKKKYSTRGVRKRVKHWFEICGFSPDLSCHSCRHTYISHLMASGQVDLATIRNNAGHSSLATTSVYSHSLKESLGKFESKR